MSDPFDDPGDLGFFDIEEEPYFEEEEEGGFYEPFPGEEEWE